MNIRARLTLQFSLIVASILIFFSLSVYYSSSEYRQEEFYSRLRNDALTTAKLFVSVQEIDEATLKIIDRNTINALANKKILIFNEHDSLIYSSQDDFIIQYDATLLSEIKAKNYLEFSQDENEAIGVTYRDGSSVFVVLASAFDRFGKSKLDNLRNVLLIGLVVGIIVILISGRLFSGQVLLPLSKLNGEVSLITAKNLNVRVNEGNKTDEIAQLAINFNKMLRRIETSFELQKNFVSNASHELRTPLAAIISQLQFTLGKERDIEHYKKALISVYEDAIGLSKMSNGLLELAQSSMEVQKEQFIPVRVDEIVFYAQEELQRQNPEYKFNFDFQEFPQDDKALTISGSAPLLKTLFINLMENACKFSPDKTVIVGLSNQGGKWVNVSFKDNGQGIEPSDLDLIFEPFYRGSKSQGIKGFGIGLSLSKSIVELHGGSIKVYSKPEKGSNFVVWLPLIH